jgi:hypothetical protein
MAGDQRVNGRRLSGDQRVNGGRSSGDQRALAFVALKSKYLNAPKYVTKIIPFSVTKSWLFLT